MARLTGVVLSPWDVWPGYSVAPEGYRDESFDFVFNSITVPRRVRQVGIPLRVDFDADFYLRSTQAIDNSTDGTFGGNFDFLVKFTDPTGRYLQKDYDLAVSLLSQTGDGYSVAGDRVPMFPEIRIPAGSLMLIDVISNAYLPSSFDLVLCGVKRRAVGTMGVGTCPVPGGSY